MKKQFNTFGVMLDMSRNAVMSVDGLKMLFPLLKKMGYNMVMLYTEDTYEIEDEPFFGYMRGRYTQQEMKELDTFASELGIEIIPCIQTLAHLDAFVRWKTVPLDYGNILLTDDDKTYEFIEKMFKSVSKCFKSRRIHVGMDEAYMLGRGKHMDLYGPEKISEIMERHLHKVMEIADKYGYEIMIWSDMYFRQWNGGAYFAPKSIVPKDVIDAFPKEVIPVYWDYYQNEEQKYADMIENHKQLSNQTWFAGGIWGWSGMIPFNKFTLESMIPALNACKKNKIRNVFMTMWGDNGAECSRYSILPSLFYLSEYAKGNTDEEKIKAKFKKFCGIDFDDFMLLDCPNNIAGNERLAKSPKNPSKYMLYSDCLNGHLDYTVKKGGGKTYAEYAEKLEEISKKSRRFGYVFDTLSKLCYVLKDKYELGVKTRAAYKANDKEELLRLANEEYSNTVSALKAFIKALRKQWNNENKTYGFEVQEIRLGGLLYRIESTKKTLLDYALGKLDRIEELECEILAKGEKEESIYYNSFVKNISSNPI